MAGKETCSDCGGELRTSPAGSFCPRCAMALGLERAEDGAPPSDAPVRVGPYTLVRRLGGGGMGEVWLADQESPVRRQVAVKIVKPGLVSDASIARFEAERQAIALMEHPSVAKIFDAGTAPDGRPYFAMEFVDGVPITEYADANALTTRARIALFLEVCEGVQHAHQKAVIHRDLKPSNILVTDQSGRPVPKIIDFGIAKALDRRLIERTLVTELGVLIGTPEYMSPEQARADGGRSVDTRSDVYSLGVVLYELLVGALPLDARRLREAGYEELLRQVRETEPPKPSDRLNATVESARASAVQAAQRRSTDVGALARHLRGELDWIAMKALAKEPQRRYDSPSEFGRDLQRYLASEPVSAGPPSMAYRASRFVRRHRLGVTMGAVVAVALLIGAAGATWGLVRAQSAEHTARREAEVSRRVTRFMVDLFKVSDPSESRGNSITAREMLDRGVDQIDTSLQDEPEIQARMMTTMGEVHLNLGLYDRAAALLSGAIERQGERLGPGHPDALEMRDQYGMVREKQGHPEEAIELHRDVLEHRRTLFGERDSRTLATQARLGSALYHAAEFEEAERLLRSAAEVQREVLGPDAPAYLSTLLTLSMTLTPLERTEEIEPLVREVLESHLRTVGEDHPATIDAMSSLAIALSNAGKLEEAEAMSLRTVQASQRVQGEDHPHTLISQFNYGALLSSVGKQAEAAPVLSDTLSRQRRVLGETHRETLLSITMLGNVLGNLGRDEEAEALLRESAGGYAATLGDSHPYTFISLANLGTFLAARAKFDVALDYTERACAGFAETFGPVNAITLQCNGNLGDVQRKMGRLDLAVPLLERTLASARAELPAGHEAVGNTLRQLGACLMAERRHDEAEEALTEAIDVLTAQVGEGNRITQAAIADLVAVYEAMGKADQASTWRAKLQDP